MKVMIRIDYSKGKVTRKTSDTIKVYNFCSKCHFKEAISGNS